MMLVAKVDAENGYIVAERQWLFNKPKSTIWSDFDNETGNGNVVYAEVPGNHVLDMICDFGHTVFLRLEALDNLYNSAQSAESMASIMLSSGLI
jgi:hypothetical protein